MKKLFSYFILLVALSTVGINILSAQTTLTEAVDFHVKTPDGTTIYLFPLLDDEGKIVVIDFFSTGCGYCQTYAPDFQQSYLDFGENEGNVYFMKINWGSDNAAVMAFDSIFGQTMPSVSGTQGGGNQVFNDYDILSYPTVIVITPDHHIFNQYIWPPDVQTIDSVVVAAGGIMVNVNEHTADDDLLLYPNPATNEVFLEFNGNVTGNVQFEISDMAGRIITSGTKKIAGKLPVSVKSYRPGTYFVRLYRDGNIFTIKRLVVNH